MAKKNVYQKRGNTQQKMANQLYDEMNRQLFISNAYSELANKAGTNHPMFIDFNKGSREAFSKYNIAGNQVRRLRDNMTQTIDDYYTKGNTSAIMKLNAHKGVQLNPTVHTQDPRFYDSNDADIEAGLAKLAKTKRGNK